MTRRDFVQIAKAISDWRNARIDTISANIDEGNTDTADYQREMLRSVDQFVNDILCSEFSKIASMFKRALFLEASGITPKTVEREHTLDWLR